MAADVREKLERFLPQAVAWENDEVMTLEEVQSVMGKRKEYEEKISTQGLEIDLVAEYARYETNVLELVLLRMARLRLKNDEENREGEKRDKNKNRKKFSGACTKPSQNGLVSLFRRTLARHRTEPSVYKLAADILIKIGEIEEAANILEEGTTVLPRCRELWHLLAIASTLSPSRSGSIALARCLTFCPNDEEALRLLIKMEIDSALKQIDAMIDYKTDEKDGDKKDDVDIDEKGYKLCISALMAFKDFVSNNMSKNENLVNDAKSTFEKYIESTSLPDTIKARINDGIKRIMDSKGACQL